MVEYYEKFVEYIMYYSPFYIKHESHNIIQLN